MEQINVIWWNKERMTYSCCHLLNSMFDLYKCKHTTPWSGDTLEGGAVFVFHGQNSSLDGIGPKSAEKFNAFMSIAEWAIFVSVGDEATRFPYHLLSHPRMKVWVQTPLPTTKADRYLIEGYPAGTKRGIEIKTLDYFFAGQVTHARRHACVEALGRCNKDNGVVVTTDGFGKGLPQNEYLEWMSLARIVPCPSGPATPDTFRIWEALECGAVPIVDARSLREETVGFWKVVLPNAPLPMIEDWATLPEVIEQVLASYERISRECQYFWRKYKLEFRDWLAKDLITLGAK
jgi:hypothetical protein